MDVQVDPNLVNQAYQKMLADANGQVALLQAAATQLQTRVNELQAQVQELTQANEKLTAESGRMDGIPAET